MKLLVLTFILSLSTSVFAGEVKAKCSMMKESTDRREVKVQTEVKKPADKVSTSVKR